ncbi:hypothetical protein PsYK624_040250 [Phanerochaete sordida]|uniref:Uncharacterized protein n=1 Tax=Phanerochaete sordida TaxID=48140 RepID=A0A9P3LBL0_9APHY|nr:hypothetical protein PsYK624_040250 [Phanerochaete sordida]
MGRWNLGKLPKFMRKRSPPITSLDSLEDILDRIQQIRLGIESDSAYEIYTSLLRTIVRLETAVSRTHHATQIAMMDHNVGLAECVAVLNAPSEAGLEFASRVRDLLSKIISLEVLANKVSKIQIYDPHAPDSHTSGLISASNSIDGIVAEMELLITSSTDSFVDHNSEDIEDIVKKAFDVHFSTRNMHSQYQIAEDTATFLSQIIDGSSSWKIADDSPHQQVHGQHTSVQKDHIVREVDLWLARGEPIYLLTGSMMGEPDTKTSAMASQLCLRFSSQEQIAPRLGAAWFFTHQVSLPMRADASLFALAYQLRPDIRSETMSAIRDYSISGGSAEAARKALRGALSSTPASSRTCTIIVLSGLDRSGEVEQVADLLLYLLSLVSEFFWLRLFLTSRPHPRIAVTLALSGFPDLIYHHQLEDDSKRWTGNVQLYLKHEVPEIRAHSIATRRLAIRSRGDMNFARTAARYLTMETNDESTLAERLKAFLKESRTSIDGLYTHIIQRVLMSVPELAFSQHHIVTLLQFIAIRNSAHITSILIFAMCLRSQEPGDSRSISFALIKILELLQCVLAMNSDGEVVFTDSQFRDFLLDNQRCIDDLFDVSREVTVPACICLEILAEATPITRTLILPCPTFTLSRRYCQNYSSLAIATWPHYIPKTASDNHSRLMSRLSSFVPSVPLAMYAWVTEQNQVLQAGKALIRYWSPMSDCSRSSRLCLQFFQFVIYVQLWRESRLPPHLRADYPNPLTKEDLASAFKSACENNDVHLTADRVDRAVIVWDTDFELYRGKTQEFYEQLQQGINKVEGTMAELLAGTYRIAERVWKS